MKMRFLFVCLWIVSCATSKEKITNPDSLTVMTYNLENLFDTTNDPSKNDETYLPIENKKSAQHKNKCAGVSKDHWRKQCLFTDWSESKLKRKMQRLADVILQVREGKGPDILIVQEVENKSVLERFNKNYLQEAGYREVVLLEGPDERGIDVGMLSRLPLVGKPILHEVKLDFIDRKTGEVDSKKEARPTRGILQAQFELPNQESLYVFGGHFPSQASPTPHRRKAIEALNAARKKLPKKAYVIAAGDFNITAKEDGEEGLFQLLAEDWLVSHQVGCGDCQGTHNYRGSWSFLDVILFSKNFSNEKWQLDLGSIRTPNKSLYQIDHWGGPARFNDGRGQKGVSDHWPLAADIVPGAIQ